MNPARMCLESLDRRPGIRERNTGIIFRYSAKSCCECEAGRIIYSSKDMAGVAEDRADIEWSRIAPRRPYAADFRNGSRATKLMLSTTSPLALITRHSRGHGFPLQ